MVSSNAYRADSPSAHHLPSSTLPEALSRLFCLCNLCERGNILGAEIELQDAIHQERNRIARELHDGVTQQITHVLHRIEYIQRLIETGYEQPIVSELHHIQSTLNGSLHELRDTMSALQSPRVEKVALVEKIRQLVSEYKKSHLEIELILKITGLDESECLSPRLKMSVWLCIQEALTNAWKHAQATSIQIQLHRLAHWLIVEISDNGVGFQPEQISIAFKQHDGEEQHFGLYIMRERIKEAGGLWELQTKPGQGTTVRARFLITNPVNELTKRQHEVLHLVSEGLTNREIARRLEVSIDTVKTHIHHIMHKLGVKDRVQAVAVAYRNRWL